MSDQLISTFASWIPTAIVLVAVGAVYMFRDALRSWITGGIQHNFDRQLAAFRTELNQKEELFKNDLTAKGRQIESLQEGALAGLVGRRALLDKRKLEAVENLWAAVVDLHRFKYLSNQMRVINFKKVANRINAEPKLRQMFEMMGKPIELEKLPAQGAAKEQPFLSARAWALFSAYQSILHHAVLQVKTLGMGIDASEFIDHENIVAILKTALPDYSSYIDENGAAAYHYLVETLEQRLLTELQQMLDGVEASSTDVENAAQIIRAVKKAEADMAPSHNTVT